MTGEHLTVVAADKPAVHFRGWTLVVLLFFAIAVNSALPIYGLAILNVHMADDLHLSRAALGGTFALYMLMTGLPGPFAAKLIETQGIRRTLVIGNIILLLGAVAMATVVSTSVTLILVAGLAIGSASAIGGPIPVQALVTRWFSRRRALAMGIVLAGSSVTGVIFPPMLEAVVRISGWRTGWWLIAALTVAIVVACLLVVIERPEDVGQSPDGEVTLSAAVANGSGLRKIRVYQTEQEWTMPDVVRAPAFWLLLGCSVGVSAVYTIFYAQAVLQMRDLGYSSGAAAYLLSLAVGAGFCAHMLISFIGDRLDPKLIWIGSLVLQSLGIGLFARAGEPILLYTAILSLGVGNAGSILCLIMLFGNWFGERAAPIVFGFGSVFSAACGAVAPVAAGYCYDATGTFAPIFYLASLLCLAGAIALSVAKPPRLSSR